MNFITYLFTTIAIVASPLSFNQLPKNTISSEPGIVYHVQDKTKLVGKWMLNHSTFFTDGKEGEPSPPIFPATWEFTSNGKYYARGGNSLNGTYILEDKKLTIQIGLPLEYEVLKLTDNKMELMAQRVSRGRVIFKTKVYLTKQK